MITEETKIARRFAAVYLTGLLINFIDELDIRRLASETDNISGDEMMEAISYWQDKISKGSE